MFTGKHGSDGRRYVGGTLALEDANVDPLRRFRDFEDLGVGLVMNYLHTPTRSGGECRV